MVTPTHPGSTLETVATTLEHMTMKNTFIDLTEEERKELAKAFRPRRKS